MSANSRNNEFRSLSLVRTGTNYHEFTRNGHSGTRDVAIIPLSSDVAEQPNKTLQGKVALIAGGASNDGLELACSLAQRGADVTIVDVAGKEQMGERIKAAVQARGQRSLIIFAQGVSEENDRAFAQDSIAEIVTMFGRLDIFIDLSAQTMVPDEARTLEHDGKHSLRAQFFPSFNLMRVALDEIAK